MANKPITMLQIRRVIQLLASGTSQRNIARQLDISRNTVKDYVLKLTRTGKSLPELLKLPEDELSGQVYNPKPLVCRDRRYERLRSLG